MPTSLRSPRLAGSLFLGCAFASLAGASIFTSDPNIDLTVTGQNVQLATIDGRISYDGPHLSVSMYQDGSGTGNKDVTVVAVMNSYVTVSGGSGRGTLIYGVNYADCDWIPYFVVAGCSIQIFAPASFVFDEPAPIMEKIYLSLSGSYTFGSATAYISPLLFAYVREADGHVVENPTFAFSATAGVNNPEPGTWALVSIGAAFLLIAKRKKSGAPRVGCPARVSVCVGKRI